MRRTRRSGGRPPKKSSAERINSAKRAIQRRRGTRVAHNAAQRAAERMAIAEEAARQQAIADAEAEAQRAADRAREAAERLEALRRPLPLSASVMGMNPSAARFVSRATIANNEMEEGLRRQESFATSFL